MPNCGGKGRVWQIFLPRIGSDIVPPGSAKPRGYCTLICTHNCDTNMEASRRQPSSVKRNAVPLGVSCMCVTRTTKPQGLTIRANAGVFASPWSGVKLCDRTRNLLRSLVRDKYCAASRSKSLLRMMLASVPTRSVPLRYSNLHFVRQSNMCSRP